ncbi:MAG: putative phosphodiesterase [Planctomycetota bacterium]
MTYPLTAIISDLHGNVPALTVALADSRKRKVERYVCLGDVVGYGAQPRECLDIVMQRCVSSPPEIEGIALKGGICLQGNHEYALQNSAEDFNPKARAAIEWTRDEINGDYGEESMRYWDFLDSIEPMALDEVAMFAHGSPRDPVREYLLPKDLQNGPKMQANFAVMRSRGKGVCFVGHSHVPAIYYQDGSIYRPRETEGPYDLGDLNENAAIVNVGSVGQPRDGDNRLSYAVFDGQNIIFVRLAYDHATSAKLIRAVPELPDFLADRLALGR